LALTAFCAVVARAPFATAMTVQPVVIDLQTSGRGMSQVITVENNFATPLPVELNVQELQLTPDGVKQTGKDPGDLLVFPPQTLIQPGQTQTFRVQYVGNPDLASSKHYYVTVAQLPVKLPQGQSAIQILYNFQVLISISPSGSKPQIGVQNAEIGQNAEGKPIPLVTLRNAANTHGYLSNGRINVVEKNATGARIFTKTLSSAEIQQTMGFGLIGGGQTRKITVPVELPDATGTVEASFAMDR
jgi:P pilus assembly chaperone PapD